METQGKAVKSWTVYPTTIWSEVNRAKQGGGDAAIVALERLLSKYYPPLKAHLVFKFRASEEQAMDWLQAFVLRKMMLGDILARAAPQKGRFRTFLLNTLDNFAIGELRRENAAKRRPAGGFVPMEGIELGDAVDTAASGTDPFHSEWARSVLADTLRRMQAECEAKGRVDRWGVFKVRLHSRICG